MVVDYSAAEDKVSCHRNMTFLRSEAGAPQPMRVKLRSY